jgi:uncharacterized protein YqjF (DUF2071 family)
MYTRAFRTDPAACATPGRDAVLVTLASVTDDAGIRPPEAVTAEPPPLGGRAVLHQRWDELAYFHWPYDPAVIETHLPAGVRADTFDGRAWVGLIPFEMRRVQLGPTPPIPFVSHFVEINVRTYVVDRLGRRAVWFFSLDVPRSAIVAVARSVFSLPYCWSAASHTVDGDHHRYEMARRRPHGARPVARIDFHVGAAIRPGDIEPLDHFLTARWALLTTRRRRLLRGSVYHEPWPLHRVDRFDVSTTPIEAAGLPAPDGPPRALYSPGVAVDLAWFEPVPVPT